MKKPIRSVLFHSSVFAVAVLLLAGAPAAAGGASDQNFARWLDGIRKEASEAGISAAVIDSALSGLAPVPRVVELDRRQPEVTRSFAEYLKMTVSQQRIDRGRQLIETHGSLLDDIRARYGVAPHYLVSLWGIETNYGGYTGGFPVIGALATLAYDGRRSAFFRQELLNALRIIDQGHVDAARMTGSWAGAMGQVQFMPSSFLTFAVDYSGDGRMDIWNDTGDALASAANYLKRSGWVPGRRWGREVRLPGGFDRSLVGLNVKKNLNQWDDLGVRRADGGALPTGVDIPASIVQPDRGGRYFLVYENFRVFLRWNRSVYFGLAVGLLADAIGGGSPQN